MQFAGFRQTGENSMAGFTFDYLYGRLVNDVYQPNMEAAGKEGKANFEGFFQRYTDLLLELRGGNVSGTGFTEQRVRNTRLFGLDISNTAQLTNVTNIIQAFGQLQAQINGLSATVSTLPTGSGSAGYATYWQTTHGLNYIPSLKYTATPTPKLEFIDANIEAYASGNGYGFTWLQSGGAFSINKSLNVSASTGIGGDATMYVGGQVSTMLAVGTYGSDEFRFNKNAAYGTGIMKLAYYNGSSTDLYGFQSNGKLRFYQLTASRVPYIDSSNDLVTSSVTPTELGYLSGVSSAIQTQLNAKLAAALTNGYIFVGDGTGTAVGVLPSLNATAGTFALSNTGAFTFPDADATHRGWMNFSTQTFTGVKTWLGNTNMGAAMTNQFLLQVSSNATFSNPSIATSVKIITDGFLAASATTGSQAIYIGMNNVGTANVAGEISVYDWSGSVARPMRIAPDGGNVMVGNGAVSSYPNSRFIVYNGVGRTNAAEFVHSDGVTKHLFSSTGNYTLAGSIAAGGIGLVSGHTFNGTAMYLSSASGTPAITWGTSGSGSALFEFQISSADRRLSFKTDHVNSNPTFSTYAMTLDSITGFLGIGIGNAAADYALKVKNTSTTSTAYFEGSRGTTTITSGQNLNITTTASSQDNEIIMTSPASTLSRNRMRWIQGTTQFTIGFGRPSAANPIYFYYGQGGSVADGSTYGGFRFGNANTDFAFGLTDNITNIAKVDIWQTADTNAGGLAIRNISRNTNLRLWAGSGTGAQVYINNGTTIGVTVDTTGAVVFGNPSGVTVTSLVQLVENAGLTYMFSIRNAANTANWIQMAVTTGLITLAEGVHIDLGTVTGTRIGQTGSKVGFLGANPSAQLPGGALIAGAAYGANEQLMLQKVYDMARTFGFLN